MPAGRTTDVSPRRGAASTFAITAPTASTSPDSAISPVIASSLRTDRAVNADTSSHDRVPGRDAVPHTLVGLHVQMHVGVPVERRIEAVPRGVRLQPRKPEPNRLLHQIAHQPGERQPAIAGQAFDLEERHEAGAVPVSAQTGSGAGPPGTVHNSGLRTHRGTEDLAEDDRRDLDHGSAQVCGRATLPLDIDPRTAQRTDVFHRQSRPVYCGVRNVLRI